MRTVNITEPTGYSWLDSWNKQGYSGLMHLIFLAVQSQNWEILKEMNWKKILKGKRAWTLKEVRVLIKERFNVEYSEMQVWRILTSWNMHHAKPYVLDNRRPRWCWKHSKKRRLEIKAGDLLGFVDESSQNINSNTQRLWSFEELNTYKENRAS